MEWLPLVISLLHIISNTLGLITNGLLIFLVLTKTPKRLATYSILIFNFAICDFLTCASAFFVQQRLIPGGEALFYSSHGPCKLFGPTVCYVGYSFMLHCYAHWLWSLLFSFSYRYHILKNSTPKTSTIAFVIVLIYVPSFVQFVSFCFAYDNVVNVKLLLAKKFNYEMESECVSGHLNIFNWKAMLTILHMTLPVAPVYIAILILRKLTITMLRTERAMSEYSKLLHEQLLKALTIQACLPAFFLLAVITYAVGQLGIYNHPLLEHATFLLSGFIPLLCPITSFYFVRPYRVWIRHRLFRIGKISPSQPVSKMVATRSSMECGNTNF